MSHQEARAWWADVEHLRETFDDRRAGTPVRPALRLVDDPLDEPAARRREERGAISRAARPARPRRGASVAVVEPVAPRTDVRATAPAEPRPRRRTVQITGRPAETAVARRLVEVEGERRRPPAPAAERLSAHPDRLAAWAVLLGVVLVLVATLSSHG